MIILKTKKYINEKLTLKNCSRQSRDETSRKYSIGGVITKRSIFIKNKYYL